jgi:hypothetical protein
MNEDEYREWFENLPDPTVPEPSPPPQWFYVAMIGVFIIASIPLVISIIGLVKTWHGGTWSP